jgi:hypothetical protein
MFRVRVFTPAVLSEDGLPQAGAELLLGTARLCFLVDLRYWRVADYERQWREGIGRLAQGAPSTALMIAWRGPGDAPHLMWALWRDDGSVYVQEQSVLPADLDSPFDPWAPYAHVGGRVAASELGLSIPEWRFDVVELYAATLGIRWPF